MKSAHTLALVAVFAAEAALFWVVTDHRYAWVYPRWFDQLQYLGQAYDGYERTLSDGFAQGVRQDLSYGSPQGSLHGLLALLMFEVMGPSRIAALSLNMAAFLALQAATFLGVRRISGSYPLAWAAVALLAGLHFPWSGGTASAVDFRLDWISACAYGVALGAAVAGDGFRSTRWAVLFGAAAGAVILLRFLTAAYFGLIFLALLSWLPTQADRRDRCGRLILSAAVALAISAPALWFSRRAIYAYYWTWRYTGPESARFDSHLGVTESFKWVFSELLTRQVGLAAAALGLGAAAALLVMGSIRRTRAGPSVPPGTPLGSVWTLALVFFAAPAAVLVFNVEKAFQTVSILIPGAVWIIILTWICLARRVSRVGIAATGAAVVLIGGLLYVGAETGRSDSDELTAEFRQINALDDYLYYRAEESGLEQPRVAVTWFLDSLNASTFHILGYERHHKSLPFLGTLPEGVLAPTREGVIHALADSDFVCLVTRASARVPFDLQMRSLLPETRQWCESNLRHVGDLEAFEFSASLYERPSLARPAVGHAVDLGAFLKAASQGPASREATPPAAPLFVAPPRALGSTQAEFRYALTAAYAYSPMRYGAQSLPENLKLNARTGEIRGIFPRAGTFTARLTATNSAGTTATDLSIQVEESSTFAVLRAPAQCRVGAPVEISYGAFDAEGKLDFIEVTDLTARKTLCRIDAPANRKGSWQGSYTLAFQHAGPRVILVRTVRFDPGRKEKYSFVDRQCEVDVVP